MNQDLLNLYIAIGAAILGVLLATFKEEILNLFGPKKYKCLKGNWQCSWNENPSTLNQNSKTIFDNLKIESVNGRLIKGSAVTRDFGEWTFKGNISTLAITLMYKNEKGTDKSGVIILKIDDDILVSENKRLEGIWCQYKKNEIVTGSTEWLKLP